MRHVASVQHLLGGKGQEETEKEPHDAVQMQAGNALDFCQLHSPANLRFQEFGEYRVQSPVYISFVGLLLLATSTTSL